MMLNSTIIVDCSAMMMVPAACEIICVSRLTRP